MTVLISLVFNDYLPWLNGQIIYIILSAIIALLIIYEGVMLKNTEGKLPKSTFFHVCSLLDTVWFFISLAALYIIDFTSIALAVPAAYCVYTIFGWVYGSRLLKAKGLPVSPKELVIPPKYIAYSQSFGLMFFILCCGLLVYLFKFI